MLRASLWTWVGAVLGATLLGPCITMADEELAKPTDETADALVFKELKEHEELEVLESAGAVIGPITIRNGSIFDLENPDEDNVLYRFANRAHITTRPHVIEQQLLFASGDLLSAQQLEESERILRSNRYIQDAQITAIPQDDGVIGIEVATTDTWTLMPKLSFSHAGGVTKSRVGLKEANLLGTGVALEVLFESDVDRDTKVLEVEDTHIGDSWYGVKVIYESSSDGFTRNFSVGKPFYSLDTTRANDLSFYDNDRVDSIYVRGKIASQYRQESQTHELLFGWSEGLKNGWAKRFTAGLGYDEHQFSIAPDGLYPATVMPTDRKLAYPFFGMEFVEDKFETVKNHDQIGRVEDRFTGTAFSFKLGLARASLGSDRDALLFSAGARTSFDSDNGSSLVLQSEFSGRHESTGLKNATLGFGARYYKRQSEKFMLFAELSGTLGYELDLDQVPYLGGDNGLRGYPLRYQTGEKLALFTLEQRYFTDWYPFHLFPVAAAVFFDVGQVWGENPLGVENDGLLRDVGVGLRFGNTRSGHGGVVHVDMAYPLDGDSSIKDVQFVVELKDRF